MDNNSNIQELKDFTKKFCEDRDWDQFHNARELAIGIVTESSELLQIFRFKSEKEIEELFENPVEKEKICEEMADIFYFTLRLAQKYHIDLSEEFYKKMNKNDNKYAIDMFKGSNKKYNQMLK